MAQKSGCAVSLRELQLVRKSHRNQQLRRLRTMGLCMSHTGTGVSLANPFEHIKILIQQVRMIELVTRLFRTARVTAQGWMMVQTNFLLW